MSLPVYFLIVAVAWWAVGLLLEVLQHPAEVDSTYLVIRTIGALIFGGVMTAIMGARRRRNGGRAAAQEVHRAFRSGELPADADPATWRPAVEWRLQQARRTRWLIVLFGVLFAGIGVLLPMVDPREIVSGVITVVLVVVMVVIVEVQAARLRPRLESLQQQLAQHG